MAQRSHHHASFNNFCERFEGWRFAPRPRVATDLDVSLHFILQDIPYTLRIPPCLLEQLGFRVQFLASQRCTAAAVCDYCGKKCPSQINAHCPVPRLVLLSHHKPNCLCIPSAEAFLEQFFFEIFHYFNRHQLSTMSHKQINLIPTFSELIAGVDPLVQRKPFAGYSQ